MELVFEHRIQYTKLPIYGLITEKLLIHNNDNQSIQMIMIKYYFQKAISELKVNKLIVIFYVCFS